jgi:hypothetical protein
MIRFDDDDINLRRRNSIEKHRRRRIEKNRFPKKCKCVVCGERFMCRSIEDYLQRRYYLGPAKDGAIRHVCWGCSLDLLVKVAARTLYHLVCAIPVAERDSNEIYPAEIPVRLEENMWLPGLGLNDYAEPARLLSRFGRYELVARQKAASPARNVPATAFRAWERLTPPETQQTLKRIGRLHKNSCWWSKKGPHSVFDKADLSSWKKSQLYKPGQRPFEWDPKDLLALESREIRQIQGGVFVGHAGYWDKPFWLSSHKRHANLEGTRASFNDGMVRIGTAPATISAAPILRKLFGRWAASTSRVRPSRRGTP